MSQISGAGSPGARTVSLHHSGSRPAWLRGLQLVPPATSAVRRRRGGRGGEGPSDGSLRPLYLLDGNTLDEMVRPIQLRLRTSRRISGPECGCTESHGPKGVRVNGREMCAIDLDCLFRPTRGDTARHRRVFSGCGGRGTVTPCENESIWISGFVRSGLREPWVLLQVRRRYRASEIADSVLLCEDAEGGCLKADGTLIHRT